MVHWYGIKSRTLLAGETLLYVYRASEEDIKCCESMAYYYVPTPGFTSACRLVDKWSDLYLLMGDSVR